MGVLRRLIVITRRGKRREKSRRNEQFPTVVRYGGGKEFKRKETRGRAIATGLRFWPCTDAGGRGKPPRKEKKIRQIYTALCSLVDTPAPRT